MNKNLRTLSSFIITLLGKKTSKQKISGSFVIKFEIRENEIVQAKLIDSAQVLSLNDLEQTAIE